MEWRVALPGSVFTQRHIFLFWLPLAASWALMSAEGPVLQGAVSHWLSERGKGMVAEFAPAPREKGGSGAFVVFLKSGKKEEERTY